MLLHWLLNHLWLVWQLSHPLLDGWLNHPLLHGQLLGLRWLRGEQLLWHSRNSNLLNSRLLFLQNEWR
jgi:hypothetical protein